MLNFIKSEIQKTRTIMQSMEENTALLETTNRIAEKCIASLRTGGKILFAGNGGSAADSQHLACELVTRLYYNRPALASIALTTDTSVLTGAGNDYSFEYIFSRQVEALGRKGDVLIGISTSGKSANILKALETARALEMVTIGFTRESAPMMTERCDLVLNVPAMDTQKVQECHIMIGHIVCALIEETMFGEQYNPRKIKQVTAST